MTLRIRSARPSELRHLAAVEATGGRLFSEWFGEAAAPALLAPPPTGFDRDAREGMLLVAVDSSRGDPRIGWLVGFAHLLLLRDDQGLSAAHLEQVAVHLPEHGRRGIGTALIEAVCAQARWEGCRSISLCTYVDVPWNGPFYRRLGFVEETEPAAYLRRVRDLEQEAGLDLCGPRQVLRKDLDRSSGR